MSAAEPIVFSGADGHRLEADIRGADGRVVLLLHGGGQTRHAWGGAARRLSARGWRAISLDLRGHGDSEWHGQGYYMFEHFAEDVVAVSGQIEARFGCKPVAVGASLGGIAALLAEGEGGGGVLDGLVLVDITPRMDPEGVDRVLSFMAAHIKQGFASIEEAADAVAAYIPHRKRPEDLTGLAKNLRLDDDGRFRWHWDPTFLEGQNSAVSDRGKVEERLVAAARALQVPVLLVRGRLSDLVSEELAREFLELVPHAAYADVSGAGHMVAGDDNDSFTRAVTAFLAGLEKGGCP
ncbi:MAG TPA: alpha/beta hydrolase [Rhodobacteraceae bacterium]|nr:alpha/beta hydrolase [Paracoccaceae bacterium]